MMSLGGIDSGASLSTQSARNMSVCKITTVHTGIYHYHRLPTAGDFQKCIKNDNLYNIIKTQITLVDLNTEKW